MIIVVIQIMKTILNLKIDNYLVIIITMLNMNDITIDQINDFNPDLIYFSVGCATNIGSHKPSDPNFCQQYPLFLYNEHFNNKNCTMS